MRQFGPAPSLSDIEAIARRAIDALPDPFAKHLEGVVLQVEDLADADLLASVGIDDPFELTGLYEGIPIGDKSADQPGALPDRILLFRLPILAEWADGEDSLEHLVAHVLIHEAGHHFGLSDQDMHAIEDSIA